jgi:hypothetical protein
VKITSENDILARPLRRARRHSIHERADGDRDCECDRGPQGPVAKAAHHGTT